MYAKYNYLTTATLLNVANDVIAILTGETNKANLSAGCDQTNTSILNTYTNAGWALHDRTANSIGTCTITNASPAVINKGTSSSLANDMPIAFTTTGGLPTGLSVGTTYYVVNVASGTCNVAATVGGAAINTSSAGSGTHTLWSGRLAILKAAVVDDGTFYKYIGLDTTNTAFFQLHEYESWNATTHALTNQSIALGTTQQQQLTIGSGTPSLIIGASARMCAFQSTIAAGIGASNANEWTGVFERSRLAPWDTVANAYPPVVLTTGNQLGASNSTPSYSACPRYKNPAGGDYTTTNATLLPALMGYSGKIASGTGGVALASGSNVITAKIPDGVGGFYCPLNDIQYRNSANQFPGGSISTISDAWLGPAYPANLDEVTYNGKTYVFWQNSNASTTITANLVIPKG